MNNINNTGHSPQTQAVINVKGKESPWKDSHASWSKKRGQRVQSSPASQEVCLKSIPPHFRKCQFIWRVQTLMPRTTRQARSPLHPHNLTSQLRGEKKKEKETTTRKTPVSDSRHTITSLGSCNCQDLRESDWTNS